jgi:hypothetical protein
MAKGARDSLPLLASALTAHIASGPEYQSYRREFQAFLHDYLSKRLVHTVGQKLRIAGCDELHEQLKAFIGEIAPTRDMVEHDHLEELASFEVFGPKARLMQGFRDKTIDLVRVVGGLRWD